jgi:uncharacterized protein YlxW (UPF0749 family)
MSRSAFETSEQVLKFDPKAKERTDLTPLDDAGQAIVAQIRTAADLANQDCDRAMSLAHKLSMELRAAEDRTHQLRAEVELWRNRAARAEEWLRTIQKEIEDKLIVRRSLSGAEDKPLHH